jgi:hypothetical protein
MPASPFLVVKTHHRAGGAILGEAASPHPGRHKCRSYATSLDAYWIVQLRLTGGNLAPARGATTFLRIKSSLTELYGLAISVPLPQSRRPGRVHGFGPVGNLELREDVGDMVAYRLGAQDEVGGNLRV